MALKIFDYEFGAEKENGFPSLELIDQCRASDTGAVRASMDKDQVWRPNPNGRLVYIEDWTHPDWPNKPR